MNDEFDNLEDGSEDDEYEAERGPSLIEYEEPVDPADYAAVIHDSFGERHVNVSLLRERGGAVTILRLLGAMELEARGEVQFYLDGNLVGPDHVVDAGQSIYIVGKLAGGR
jgi:hypothetical protein